MTDQPATRGELLRAVQQIHAALLVLSTFGASMIDGDDELRRRVLEQTLDASGNLIATMREWVTEWSSNDG